MKYRIITDTIVGGIRDLHEEIDNIQQENTQVKQELLESYKAIANRHVHHLEGKMICEYCGCMHEKTKNIVHRPDCIVLKAEKFIKENE